MPADSLLAISQRAAARGAGRIYSIGDLPYHLAAPVLARVPSPKQLYEIEQASPQIIGCVDDPWLAFLKRDVPNFESKPHRPANPASWFKVYKKMKRQAEAELKTGQDALKAALGAIKQTKEQNTAMMVSRFELPRGSTGVGRKPQSRYDYMSGKTGAKGAHKMTLFEKIKKEKADIRTNKMNRPVNVRPGIPGTVKAAPSRMVETIVEERKRLEEEKRKERAVRAPKAPVRVTGTPDEVGYDLMADREARLRAMKNKEAVQGLSEPRSPPMTGQKRSAEQAGLTADSLEDLFDDEDLASDGGEDGIFGTLPTTTRLSPLKPNIVRKSPEKTSLPPPTSASATDHHRKLLDPGPKSGVDARQRSASSGRIGSPKPMVKRKAPPSLFHTPNKRVVTRS